MQADRKSHIYTRSLITFLFQGEKKPSRSEEKLEDRSLK